MTLRDTLIDTLVEETSGNTFLAVTVFEIVEPRAGGGGSNFPYILLNEIQTMFSQHAKQSVRF